MKKEFSKKWKASKQPRKQRKYIFNAPLHIKVKQMTAPLDKVLRKTQGIKNAEVRKGDEVKIMRGKHKGKQGKIDSVDVGRSRVSVEGIIGKKKDGNSVVVWFNPSKLQIKSLKSDPKRFKARTLKSSTKLENKKVSQKKNVEKTEKKVETEKINKEKENAPKKK